MDLRSIKNHIKQVCGLTFEADKEVVLISGLQSRMATLKTDDIEAYLKCVADDPDEFQSLVNLLTINETYFFRETQHIDLLKEYLLPRLLTERAGSPHPIRILCAGCSSGEEPYTLAIALQEAFGCIAAQQFAITAADIDSHVLARAKSAIYSGLSFRNMPVEMVARWFTPYEKNRFQLKDTIRNMVRFRQLNLLEDSYPMELIGQDVIMFRNVSIYFDTEVRKSVQTKLAALLNDGGALIVGLTESLPNDFGILTLTVDKGVFYFVKAKVPPKPDTLPPEMKSPRPAPTAKPLSRPPRKPLPPLSESGRAAAVAPCVEPSFDHAMACIREKRYDEALAEINQLELLHSVDARYDVLRAHVAFNRKDMGSAKTAAQQALKHDEWNLDAMLLLAQIARLQDQPDEAVRWLKQVVYHQPQCWPAHYWLAEIFRQGGENDKAGREYRIVVNQTAAEGGSGIGLLMFPLGVSPQEVGALCRHQLKKLGAE